MPVTERKTARRDDSRLGRFAQTVDRAIYAVAPGWGSKRIARRQRFEMQARNLDRLEDRLLDIQNRVFGGADHDRLHGRNWIASRLSPNSALELDLEQLRQRNRELYRDDPYYHGAVEGDVTNVIGRGIMPQPHLERNAGQYGKALNEGRARKLNEQIGELFWRWSRRADKTRRMTFYEVLRLAWRSRNIDGECFIMLHDIGSSDSPVPLALEVIDADRVQTPPGEASNPLIRMGVEHDEAGRVVAYHVRTTNPYDTKEVAWKWDRIEADRIIHSYDRLFPGQSRGLPRAVATTELWKDLKDFRDAKLIQEQIAACHCVFVTTPGDPGEVAGANRTLANSRVEAIEPGRVDYIGEGQDVKVVNPGTSGDTLPSFMGWLLRAAAAAIQYPYELLVKDYRELSYSGGRLSLLDGRKTFRLRQDSAISQIVEPIWERLIFEGILAGEVAISPLEYQAEPHLFHVCDWQAEGWPWVDPEKEVAASDEACQTDQSNLHIECAARGVDYDEMQAVRHQERLQKVEQMGELVTRGKALGLSEETVVLLFTGKQTKTAPPAAPAAGAKGPAKRGAENHADELEPVGAAA